MPACPLAAKCFVEVVIEMYQQGASVDDVKVALSLAGLQHGGKLLSPLDEASGLRLCLLPCKGTVMPLPDHRVLACGTRRAVATCVRSASVVAAWAASPLPFRTVPSLFPSSAKRPRLASSP